MNELSRTASIIVLNYNTCDLLLQALQSISPALSIAGWQIIVVDNASTDGSPAMVARDFPAVQLIRSPENLGFARGNNLGIRASDPATPYVLLLNSDTIVNPGSLTALVRFMDAHPEAGAVSPCLLRPDGTPQPYAFGYDPTPGYLLRRGFNQLVLRRHLHDWATEQLQTVDWVSGACLLVRRAAIEQIGLLDENMFMYFEDNDWCLRIRKAGWKVYYYPQTEIVHLGGQSLKRNPQAQRAYFTSLRYFYRKHYTLWMRVFLALFLPVYRLVAGR